MNVRLDSVGPGGHAILVYETEYERDQMLSHYLAVRIKKRNCVRLLSTSPREEIRYLKKLKLSNEALNRSLIAEDVTDALSKQRSQLHVTRKIRDMQELVNSGKFHEWALVGDWAGMYYDRPDILLRTEQSVANLKHSGRIVCCYPSRGLCGLRITDLSKLVGFHNYVLCPRETFVF